MSQEMFDKLAAFVTEGKKDDAGALAKEALEKGLDPLPCITEGLTKGIQKDGDLFASGEFFLPDLMFSAGAMQTAMDILEKIARQALDTRPSEFYLYDLDGNQTVHYGGDSVQFVPGSGGITILDSETQKQRQALTEDLVKFVKLEKKGSKSTWERAKDRVNSLLTQYQPSPISDEVKKELSISPPRRLIKSACRNCLTYLLIRSLANRSTDCSGFF
jgi:hypothetical protein